MKRIALVLAALISAIVLAACGDNDGSSTTSPAGSSSSDHNTVDVAFAQGMIPHHRQAVEMAEMALTRSGSEEVRSLARTIRDAQEPEIATMTGWLQSWGVPTVAPQVGGHGGAHNGARMPAAPMPTMAGMTSNDDMMAMRGASGSAFDRMFLTMMITHHEGAISMAETELRDGLYAPAKDLARSIRTSQSEEITKMKAMLAKL